MNNKQELLDTIDLKTTSKIPYTFDGTKECREMLCNYLKLPFDTDFEEYFNCNSFSSLWSALGAEPSLPKRMEKLQSDDPNIRFDIWGVKREYTNAGDAWYWEITEAPLATCESVSDIENYDWPTADDIVLPELPKGLDLLEWKKDKVTLDCNFICPFGTPWAMRGMEQFMMDLCINPGMVEAIVNKVEEYCLGGLSKVIEKYPGMTDFIGCGDDYGTQNGLLISPDSIQKFFMPSLKRHYDFGRKHGIRGYHHSCGAIFDIIPYMIEAGVNILNPIQTYAAGMDTEKIKQAFGKDLCFHGGMDTQEILVASTEQEVRDEVRRLVETLGPNGYIFAPSHVLQVDAKPENIIAMYDEIQKI